MDDAQARLGRIDEYIASLFGGDDQALGQNLADAKAAGLPPINVSANQGRLLCLLAKMSRAGGARAFNAVIAAHPLLDSIILPIVRDTIDGMSISIVR
jgi:hypothetical protein